MADTEETWETPKAKGWRLKKKAHAGHSNGVTGEKQLQDARPARPTRLVEGITVQKLVQEYVDMEKKWNGTECAKRLERLLSKKEWDVKEAVGIGVGSFSLDWEHRYRSLWQLVLFANVRRLGGNLVSESFYTSVLILSSDSRGKSGRYPSRNLCSRSRFQCSR
jgi:hypothetical protein